MIKSCLFITSSAIAVEHGSGETEALLLQIGFKMVGVKCDEVGLESDDILQYESYCAFSLRPDVLRIISSLPREKTVYLFPFCDFPIEVSEQESIKVLPENVVVVSRSRAETKQLVNAIGEKRVEEIPGWFLPPFVSKSGLSLPDSDNRVPYVLALVNSSRVCGLKEFAKLALESGISCRVVADDPSITEKVPDVVAMRQVTYGSPLWYGLLQNALAFYEPNPRTTSSLLEAAWLGKTVYSPNADLINNTLNCNLTRHINAATLTTEFERILAGEENLFQSRILPRMANTVAFHLATLAKTQKS